MISYNKGLSFDDILLVPRYSDLESRSEANVSSYGYDLPLVMSPMDTITTQPMIKYFIDNNLLASVHRYFKTPEEQFEFVKQLGKVSNKTMRDEVKLGRVEHKCFAEEYYQYVYFAVGSIKKHKGWIDYLFKNGVHRFMVDMAMGNSKLCVETVEYIKSLEYNVPSKKAFSPSVIAGNIVTKNGMERLINADVSGVRVGIGGGSICSTSLKTSFGVPQFSAILSCAERKIPETIIIGEDKDTIEPGVMLIADGGIRASGDIAKAMFAGADMVMCGKLFASTDLAGGECYDKNGNVVESIGEVVYKEYHGMASKKARENVMSYASVEGVSGKIPYTGTTKQILIDMKLNLQASLSYAGVRNWNDFRRVVKPIEVTTGSAIERQTHVL